MSSHPDDPAAVRAASAVRRLARRVTGASQAPDAERDDVPDDAPAPPRPATAARLEEARRAARDQARRADRTVRAQWRLLQAVLGGRTAPEALTGVDPEPELVTEAVALGRRARAMSAFADRITRGHGVRRAHVETVRGLCDAGLRPAARAFVLGAEPLVRDPDLSALGRGLVLHSMTEFDLAWRELSRVDLDELRALVPVEAVTAALATGTPEAVAAAREIGGDGSGLASQDLVELAGRFLVTGHVDLARELGDLAETRDDLDPVNREALASLRRWTHPTAPPAPPPGRISLAVMDYHQPDHHRASRNVGDYVQTLAMLGNLVRFQDTRFHGEEGVGELMHELQGRVPAGLRIPGHAVDVQLTPVSRDFSSGDPVPEHTWMVGFGWHLHSTFRLAFGLPYHPHVHPVFVSFHLNRVRALTPEVVAYLQQHGPVGCRDWTTVDLLLGAGVDAFFTGCVTTTVDGVFPETGDTVRDPHPVVGAVDLKPVALHKIKRRKEVLTHAGAEYREASFAAATRAASDLLAHYQRRFDRVVTSRLHSYLPATSLGIPVRFRPPIAGDIRFDGLLDLTPDAPEFAAIRDDIRGLLADVHGWILSGLDEGEVYARWRDRTAPLVARARQRWTSPPASLGADEGGPISVPRHVYGPHDEVTGPVTDVSVSIDGDLAAHLPTTLESVLAHTATGVRLWLTTRGLGEEFRSAFARAYPDLPVTFLVCDGLDQRPELDRLLLPVLADGVARLVHLDVDTVLEGDVADLAATDLGGHPFAARSGRGYAAELWRTAGDQLAPRLASELRRTMSARHPFDLPVPDAGVLVLDLARLRADGLVETSLPLARRYGLDAAGALVLHAGADRVDLPPRWNTLPLLDPPEAQDQASLWHFAGLGRPWDDEPVPGGDHWRRHAQLAAARLRSAGLDSLVPAARPTKESQR